MTVHRLKLAGVAIACFAFLAAAPGAALAQSKCDAGLTKATGKKEGCLCGVYAKSQAKNLPADSGKLQKCKDKFAASCTKAQSAADCVLQTDTCANIETNVENHVANLCNPGAPTQASKCDAGITKSAGKKVACKCGVYAKSYAKNLPADSAKLQKCTDKFTAKCTKATSAADCSVQTQTCAQIETAADGDVADLCIFAPGTTTTTTSASTTTTMGGPCCGINPTKLNFTTSTGTGRTPSPTWAARSPGCRRAAGRASPSPTSPRARRAATGTARASGACSARRCRSRTRAARRRACASSTR